MLTSVELKHFKNIGNQKVPLGPLNVLVGRNGAGKSNFIDALRFLRDCFSLGVDAAVSWRGGIPEIRQWGTPVGTPVAIAAEGMSDGERWRYEIELRGEGDSVAISREAFFGATARDRPPQLLIEVENGDFRRRPEGLAPELGGNLVLPLVGRQEPYRVAVSNVRDMYFYSLKHTRMGVLRGDLSHERLDEDGLLMAATLRDIKSKSPEKYDELTRGISRIAENVDDVRTRGRGERLVIEFHHPAPRPHWRSATHESDGTLRALGLLAARYQAPEPSLSAVEEPELNLHPGAMGLMADTFVEASLNTQIILTTHSPDLISRFPVESLLVVESMDGEAHIGPIDETQREIVEEQLFSAGDLLRIEGGLERRIATDGAR